MGGLTSNSATPEEIQVYPRYPKFGVSAAFEEGACNKVEEIRAGRTTAAIALGLMRKNLTRLVCHLLKKLTSPGPSPEGI